MYSTTQELARILKITNPSAAQSSAMERVLTASSLEVDREIDRVEMPLTDPDEIDLATQVALQRASELWFLQEVPLGLAGIGSEFGTAHLARNSWEKYAFTLAPLKEQFGLA